MAPVRQILYRRAILIYLLAIAVPALVLLYLGIQSVERQRRAMETLLVANRRLSEEKLAAELARRTALLAEACLRDQQTVSYAGAELEKLRRKHPIAHHFFLLEDGRVIYPPLRTPPPVPFEELLSPRDARFAALFREAEKLELRLALPADAVSLYRQAFELPAPDALKALVLSRAARALKNAQQLAAAEQAWRTLAERYGDLSDLSHRPYALVAGLETNRLAGLYEDLVRGRWAVSAEQMDYFLERLSPHLPASDTRYLDLLRFGRSLEENFRHAGPLQPDQAYRYAFGSYQIFYRLAAQGRLIGFAVNRNWVEQQLVPQIRTDLGFTATPASEPRRELWIYAGSTALVVCLLLMGVFLLVRDVARETRLTQLRADFVSGVSHELKTPLTLIRLYGETLLEGQGFPEEERREFYQIITRESERLTHLIEKVLVFSRIERGEKQYRFQVGDLAPVVARTVEIYEHYLKRRGFTVEAQLAPQLPAVRFDPDAVCQAVVNLLDNAEKYSGDAKFVGVRLRAEDNEVIFEVEDRGVGIPRAEHEKIFQRFYRVPGNTGQGGYGLGLFLVRHIMEAHGGSVELASEPGRGSRFRLVFPVVA